MANINLPGFDEMAPAIQDKARPILEKTGKLGEILQLLAVHEKVFFATDGMAQAYLLEETELPFSVKESIALLVSKENSCRMCIDVHKGLAKMLGMTEQHINEVLQGIDAITTSDKEKALLRFCVKASRKDNYKILKSEIDEIKSLGYTDQQLLEAVAITGYFNYINTLSNVFSLGE
jgi:uncharacterized peroxidase-related enzyme